MKMKNKVWITGNGMVGKALAKNNKTKIMQNGFNFILFDPIKRMGFSNVTEFF